MTVNRKIRSASSEVSSAKSKQPRAYSVQQTDNDKNKKGTATGEKGRRMICSEQQQSERTVISGQQQANSNSSEQRVASTEQHAARTAQPTASKVEQMASSKGRSVRSEKS